MTANIMTPRQVCKLCKHRLPRDEEARRGDVRRCEHGRYWLWRRDLWRIDGEWIRLSWLSNPILLRRARRAVNTAKLEVLP